MTDTEDEASRPDLIAHCKARLMVTRDREYPGWKLNPEEKKHWLLALRGGAFPQITGNLRNCSGYCCLGVFADTVKHVPWHPYAKEEDAYNHFDGVFYFRPTDDRKFDGGLPDDWIPDLVQEELIAFNDHFLYDGDEYRLTFAEIADIVEEVL